MVEADALPPLPSTAGPEARAAQYASVLERLALLLEGEPDWVAAMATVACELHSAFEFYHWTGFYRSLPPPALGGEAAGAAGAAASDAPAAGAAAGSAGPAAGEGMLVVGPYQGSLGCLRIPFSKGVCGAAARTRQTQLVPDVHAFPGHIACASTTQSEVVVPVLTPDGRLLAVLDVDSDLPAAFTDVDAQWLERLCADLGARPWSSGL
ncbi:hypothetical protein ABPG77_009405 [Micractinium sp. CCAP 211/92]